MLSARLDIRDFGDSDFYLYSSPYEERRTSRYPDKCFLGQIPVWFLEGLDRIHPASLYAHVLRDVGDLSVSIVIGEHISPSTLDAQLDAGGFLVSFERLDTSPDFDVPFLELPGDTSEADEVDEPVLRIAGYFVGPTTQFRGGWPSDAPSVADNRIQLLPDEEVEICIDPLGFYDIILGWTGSDFVGQTVQF